MPEKTDTETEKPDWWPENPYPSEVFPMTIEEYVEMFPDERQRAAIAGCLGRQFWGLASDAIYEAMLQHEMEDDDER